eukprot:6473168-Amphidinium_carterae.1
MTRKRQPIIEKNTKKSECNPRRVQKRVLSSRMTSCIWERFRKRSGLNVDKARTRDQASQTNSSMFRNNTERPL